MQHTILILRDIHLSASTIHRQIKPDDPIYPSVMFILNMAQNEIERLSNKNSSQSTS